MNKKDFKMREEEAKMENITTDDILCIDDADSSEGLAEELENITTDDILCVDDTDFPEGPKHSKHYDAGDIDCIDE